VSGTVKQSSGWRRLIAQGIDVTLVFLTIIVTVVIVRYSTLAMFLGTVVGIQLTYSTLMDCYYGGTVGKLYLKIKVVTTSKRPRLLTSFYRNFIKMIIGVLLFESILLFLLVEYVGIHNFMSDCKVIDEVDDRATAANMGYASTGAEQ